MLRRILFTSFKKAFKFEPSSHFIMNFVTTPYSKYFFVFICIVFCCLKTFAQYDAPLYASYTTDAAKAKLYDRLIKYSINKNLSLPLNDSTEENWEDAFSAIEVLLYKSPFTDEKIHTAFQVIEQRSTDFQKALLELAYSNYPGIFFLKVKSLLNNTTDPKVFALCAEYLFQQKKDSLVVNTIEQLIATKFGDRELLIQRYICYRFTYQNKKQMELFYQRNCLRTCSAINFSRDKLSCTVFKEKTAITRDC